MTLLRIDRAMSRFGYCSRSEVAAWLKAGRVRAGGEIIRDASLRIDPAELWIDDQPIEFPHGLFIMLHKPVGCVCSHADDEGPTIYDLLPARWRRRNPAPNSIGRLDRDTSGLLLITDDGELNHRLASPKQAHEKVYEATLDAEPPAEAAELFAAGSLRLDGESKPCRPARLEMLGDRQARVTITEGRYHQVRRMFAAVGCTVLSLHRTTFGPYQLGDLPVGQWRQAPQPGPSDELLVQPGHGVALFPERRAIRDREQHL